MHPKIAALTILTLAQVTAHVPAPEPAEPDSFLVPEGMRVGAVAFD